jgi:hypothetical protein
MTIGELVKQGLHYARTCKSLWLFGFFIGITSGGGSSSGNGGADSAAAGAAGSGGLALGLPLPPSIAVAIIVVLLLLVVLGVLMRFISGGALIEGVARVRAGGRMTTAEGFRAGWTHWGVLFRIALVYGLVTILTLAVVGVPVALVFRAFGVAAGVTVAIPAIAVVVPWLVTLYLVQAFASQIAVLEDRRALDAIAKARLFLHGRLMHGLKLVVATFLGTLLLVVATFAAMVPVGVLLVLLARTVSTALAIVLGLAIAIPLLAVMAAMIGTLRSSIWTIGYVSEARA